MTCQICPPSLPSSPSSFEAARARCNLSGVRSLLHIAWVRRIPRSPCGVASTAWHGDAHISRCQKAWHVCFDTVEQFRHKVSGGAGPRGPLQQPLHVKRVVWQPTRFAALHAASREEVGVFSSIDRRSTAQNCVCRAGVGAVVYTVDRRKRNMSAWCVLMYISRAFLRLVCSCIAYPINPKWCTDVCESCAVWLEVASTDFVFAFQSDSSCRPSV